MVVLFIIIAAGVIVVVVVGSPCSFQAVVYFLFILVYEDQLRLLDHTELDHHT